VNIVSSTQWVGCNTKTRLAIASTSRPAFVLSLFEVASHVVDSIEHAASHLADLSEIGWDIQQHFLGFRGGQHRPIPVPDARLLRPHRCLACSEWRRREPDGRK